MEKIRVWDCIGLAKSWEIKSSRSISELFISLRRHRHHWPNHVNLYCLVCMIGDSFWTQQLVSEHMLSFGSLKKCSKLISGITTVFLSSNASKTDVKRATQAAWRIVCQIHSRATRHWATPHYWATRAKPRQESHAIDWAELLRRVTYIFSPWILNTLYLSPWI